jgi:hypothetical protein
MILIITNKIIIIYLSLLIWVMIKGKRVEYPRDTPYKLLGYASISCKSSGEFEYGVIGRLAFGRGGGSYNGRNLVMATLLVNYW